MPSTSMARLAWAMAGGLAAVGCGGAAAAAASSCGGATSSCGGDDGAFLQFAEPRRADGTALLSGKPGAIAEDRDQRGAPGGGEPLDIDLLKADHNTQCDSVLLTTFLGQRKDPMRGGHIPADFAYLERYYRSVMSLPSGRARAVILHDFLPENITSKYTTADGTVSFVEVNSSAYDRKLGNNDLRYLLYEDLIKKHPEWRHIYMTDGQDVIVVHNPCVLSHEQPDKLFVHSQAGQTFDTYTWIGKKFREMGGKYLEWHNSHLKENRLVLNAGILGGQRDLVLEALRKINTALMDPELARRKNNTQVAVNMAAFNYVLYHDFPGEYVTGPPVHSRWFRYENRTDVYFWHK